MCQWPADTTAIAALTVTTFPAPSVLRFGVYGLGFPPTRFAQQPNARLRYFANCTKHSCSFLRNWDLQWRTECYWQCRIIKISILERPPKSTKIWRRFFYSEEVQAALKCRNLRISGGESAFFLSWHFVWIFLLIQHLFFTFFCSLRFPVEVWCESTVNHLEGRSVTFLGLDKTHHVRLVLGLVNLCQSGAYLFLGVTFSAHMSFVESSMVVTTMVFYFNWAGGMFGEHSNPDLHSAGLLIKSEASYKAIEAMKAAGHCPKRNCVFQLTISIAWPSSSVETV